MPERLLLGRLSVNRNVRLMVIRPPLVVAAIDHLAAEAAEQHGQAHAKLARLLREVAENHPSLRDPV